MKLAKAKEWVTRFNTEGVNVEEVVVDFALETRQLVDERTKKSKDMYKGAATDGALREQRQKWDAICRQTNILSPAQFDSMVVAYLNDVQTEQDTWQKKISEGNPKQEKVSDGRSLTSKVEIAT